MRRAIRARAGARRCGAGPLPFPPCIGCKLCLRDRRVEPRNGSAPAARHAGVGIFGVGALGRAGRRASCRMGGICPQRTAAPSPEAPTLHRRWLLAKGFKKVVCLQRVDEGPTVVGGPRAVPFPAKIPRGISDPRSAGARTHALGGVLVWRLTRRSAQRWAALAISFLRSMSRWSSPLYFVSAYVPRGKAESARALPSCIRWVL